ncbi:MAG: hypothetical protein LBM93_07515 [Oscillospiraceae bacterium]|jgi:hypothetical protein|nr:hypothetical protein [Oscillospiraceae bacterium]
MSFFMINTDKANSDTHEQEMFSRPKASIYGNVTATNEAFFDMKKGDMVFFYRDNVGVVAYGFIEQDVFEEYNTTPYEYAHPLLNFHILEEPLDYESIVGKPMGVGACWKRNVSKLGKYVKENGL